MDFRRVLPEATIYVYDNNSTDGTADLARTAGAVVRHEYQQGKGNVIRRMFREIDAEAYIMVDGDDTYPAEAAPEMVKAVTEHQADMVVGDRLSSTYYTQNKRPFHNFGNDLVRFFTNNLFGGQIKDIMTGYRAFSYQFVKTYPVLSRGFEIETEMTIHALHRNMQVENVIIDYRDRPAGGAWHDQPVLFGPCSGRIFCHRPCAALPYADRVCLRTGGGAFAVYFRRDPFQPADKG